MKNIIDAVKTNPLTEKAMGTSWFIRAACVALCMIAFALSIDAGKEIGKFIYYLIH
jgi:hypothetical protein